MGIRYLIEIPNTISLQFYKANCSRSVLTISNSESFEQQIVPPVYELWLRASVSGRKGFLCVQESIKIVLVQFTKTAQVSGASHGWKLTVVEHFLSLCSFQIHVTIFLQLFALSPNYFIVHATILPFTLFS